LPLLPPNPMQRWLYPYLLSNAPQVHTFVAYD
jgi:hypothetical protein